MRTSLGCLAVAIMTLTGGAHAQQPAAGPAPPAVANPTYTSLVLEVTVNRPAADVWKRVGKFCDAREWMPVACEITAGKDGELGSVRTIGNGQILVAKTDLSYTFTQPVRIGEPYNLYHGTLEAKPITATTSKLIHSFVYDNSMLANDAARATERANRLMRFMQALENMKIIAEGGSLPAAPH